MMHDARSKIASCTLTHQNQQKIDKQKPAKETHASKLTATQTNQQKKWKLRRVNFFFSEHAASLILFSRTILLTERPLHLIGLGACRGGLGAPTTPPDFQVRLPMVIQVNSFSLTAISASSCGKGGSSGAIPRQGYIHAAKDVNRGNGARRPPPAVCK